MHSRRFFQMATWTGCFLAVLTLASVSGLALAQPAQPDAGKARGLAQLDALREFGSWMRRYQSAQDPESVAPAIGALSAAGALLRVEAEVTGFVAGVLDSDPAAASALIARLVALNLPPREQQVIPWAIWHSSLPDSQSMLESLTESLPAQRDGIRKDLIGTPRPAAPLVEVPFDTKGSPRPFEILSHAIELLWGYYWARRDEAIVVRMISALSGYRSRTNVDHAIAGARAKTSLTFHAADDEKVMAICREQLTKQAPEVVAALKEVIAGAEGRTAKGATPAAPVADAMHAVPPGKSIVFLIRPSHPSGQWGTLQVTVNGSRKLALENATFTRIVVEPGNVVVVGGGGGFFSFARDEIQITAVEGEAHYLVWRGPRIPPPSLLHDVLGVARPTPPANHMWVPAERLAGMGMLRQNAFVKTPE